MRSQIIDDAVAAAKPTALTRDITGAFGIVDIELADRVQVTEEDLKGLHARFERLWDTGHFIGHDQLLASYAQAVLKAKPKLCCAA